MLFGPKSCDVTDTAVAKIKPELRPIRAVPATRIHILLLASASRKKASGIGIKAMVIHPVRAKKTLLLPKKMNFSIYKKRCSFVHVQI